MTLRDVFYLSVLLAAGARDGGGHRPWFAAEYFARKEVGAVASCLCTGENTVGLLKEFSKRKIKFGSLDLRRLNATEAVERVTSRFSKLGVLLDLECPRSVDLLKEANKNNLFAFSNSMTFWLVFTGTHISKGSLETLTQSYPLKVSDPMEYLTQAYEDRKNEKYLLDINKKVNWEFIRNHEMSRRTEQSETGILANKSEMDDLFRMDVLLDSELALAVPGCPQDDQLYALYAVWKATAESRPTILESGKVGRGDGLELRRQKKRKDLGNGLLKAASAILQPEAFTTMDDLATRDTDVWSKMSYPHVKLLAEDLNFRIITRFFDDYGWQKNGTFGHLMGFLQQKKADLSAAALLMRLDRFDAVDFLKCPFRMQTGILFREPPLSSVANIFLLPFSKGTWTSIGVVVFLTTVALRCRVAAGKMLLPPDEHISDFSDIANYIVGAICQQGFSSTPKSISARTSILTILLTSLALFTSYSACIVALLQSSSSVISTVADITRSDFEVGIQANFPLYKVLIQEAAHPVLKEFYSRKVLTKGEKAFRDRREGIERMRTGMFAFEVELTAGYKQIRETYEENEKCGIREIDLVPKPFICMAVRKPSSYKEIFSQRLVWQHEAGLFDRSWKLWVDRKPKCEVGRMGFKSVGLTEFGPALQVFACGTLAAALVFFVEILHEKKKGKGLLANFFEKFLGKRRKRPPRARRSIRGQGGERRLFLFTPFGGMRRREEKASALAPA